MTATLSIDQVECFRTIISCRLGLHFDDTRLELLGEVLGRRIGATRKPCASYLHSIAAEDVGIELSAIAREITVPETYFFRNRDQFRALSERVLADRLAADVPTRQLRLLSAGCATGEEAYSLEIVLRETVDSSWDSSVLAVDINPEVLEKAQQGRFSSWALRETSPEIERRWFERDGRDYVLAESIRTAVRFEQRNLVEDDPELWATASYDVVFCRNVTMYFTPEHSRALVARIARALVPGGYLFLGHAETLRGLSEDFHLCHTHDTFYYQRKGSPLRPVSGASHAIHAAEPSTTLLIEPAETADAWVTSIAIAAERVQQLTTSPPASAGVPVPEISTRVPLRSDLTAPLELLRQERFGDAIDVIDALVPAAARDPDVLLLQAALLAHGGLHDRAEEVCRRLLEVDELNAGAHYVLALTYEGAGDLSRAIEHHRVAIYLDPGFAMPRLRLGLLARGSEDWEGVRREFTAAVSLLRQENAERVLLFGGGFSREALTDLCRSELAKCGER